MDGFVTSHSKVVRVPPPAPLVFPGYTCPNSILATIDDENCQLTDLMSHVCGTTG